MIAHAGFFKGNWANRYKGPYDTTNTDIHKTTGTDATPMAQAEGQVPSYPTGQGHSNIRAVTKAANRQPGLASPIRHRQRSTARAAPLTQQRIKNKAR